MLPLKSVKFLTFFLMCLALLCLLVPAARAQVTSLIPAGGCAEAGYCTLCDAMQFFINVGKFILGIVGSLALLMFVYGGIIWVTSGGEAGKVDKGKKILLNSVIGIAIAFFAWTVVAFVVTVITSQNTNPYGTMGKSFAAVWQGQLTCAPLPGLETALPSGVGTGGTSGGKEGDACESTNGPSGKYCGSNLYCQKSSKVCAKKMSSGTVDDSAKYGCVGMEIGGKDNLACQSGKCAGVVGGLFPGCFSGQCCGAGGSLTTGSSCVAQNCGSGLFCQVTSFGSSNGKCAKKSGAGQPCASSDVVGGGADYECQDGLSCQSGVCATYQEPDNTIL